MALIDPGKPTTLTHGNGEREAVTNVHIRRGLIVVITETGSAYTLHDEGRNVRATYFADVPDRVDRSNARDVVQWYVSKKIYDKIRRDHQ